MLQFERNKKNKKDECGIKRNLKNYNFTGPEAETCERIDPNYKNPLFRKNNVYLYFTK